jgi:HK97 family phage major capsid protein
MSDRPARRVIETLLSIPWALSEEHARRLLAIAERRGTDLQAIAAERGKPLDHTRSVTVREGVATIPITGPLFRYADIFAEVSGATSYEALARDFTAALADPNVKAILFDVDSPGGEVFGASETSDLLFNARGIKPMVAHVGGMCASAALWIASAADEISVSSVALLGSVGAMMSITVPDPERQAELFGERQVEFISSQSPDKNLDPTSKAGRDQYQAIVDKIAGVFGADLARNFGLKEKEVFSRFGLGKVFVGTDAVEAGMASRIATFEATHTALAKRVQTTGGGLVLRRAASRDGLAATSVDVAALLRAVDLEVAVRPAAALRGFTIGAGFTKLVQSRLITSPAVGDPAAASPPAPLTADHQEDRTMADATAAAPASGAPDHLAAFKARLSEISNLCAAAGCPERAVELAESDKSIAAIGLELLQQKKAAAGVPEPLRVPGDVKAHGMVDREAVKPFASLGEQLHLVALAGRPGGYTDKRLIELSGAASGGQAGVGGDGGFLVQKDFSSELMKEGFETGTLASRCSSTEIGANSNGLQVAYIDETSRATGSRWGGVEVFRRAEAETVDKKKPTIGEWTCELQDLMGKAFMTQRQLDDAAAMQAVYNDAFVDEFAFKIDDEIYRGSGVAQILGVLTAACTVEVAKESGQLADTIVFKNISKMWARILPRAKANGVWVINTECSPQLDELQVGTGTSGSLVYMPPGGLNDSPYGRLKGRPVIEIEHASALGDKGDIAYLDLNYFKLISKGGIRAEQSMHVRFEFDEMCFKWVVRVNGAPKLKSAITPFKGAASATLSPFVTLAARA